MFLTLAGHTPTINTPLSSRLVAALFFLPGCTVCFRAPVDILTLPELLRLCFIAIIIFASVWGYAASRAVDSTGDNKRKHRETPSTVGSTGPAALHTVVDCSSAQFHRTSETFVRRKCASVSRGACTGAVWVHERQRVYPSGLAGSAVRRNPKSLPSPPWSSRRSGLGESAVLFVRRRVRLWPAAAFKLQPPKGD